MEEGANAFRKHVPPRPFDWTLPAGAAPRPRAFFNVSIDGSDAGKIVFELAEDVVPNTVKNFKALCSTGGKFTYANTKMHTVFKGVAVMGGDVEKNDGTGGHSGLGTRYIADENFIIPHTQRGLISMASVGRDTGASQFYISFNPNPHLNGYCVVFGRVVEGDNVLAALEKVGFISNLYTFVFNMYSHLILLLYTSTGVCSPRCPPAPLK
jgi:peptidylprolyl isomerase